MISVGGNTAADTSEIWNRQTGMVKTDDLPADLIPIDLSGSDLALVDDSSVLIANANDATNPYQKLYKYAANVGWMFMNDLPASWSAMSQTGAKFVTNFDFQGFDSLNCF